MATINQPTKNTAFATVLATMVRDRCKAERAPSTLRTGLQSQVPLNERPYVRRGVDALIDLGMIAVSGENIGLTRNGSLLLDLASPGVRMQEADVDVLAPLLEKIDEDVRLAPSTSVDDIRTLPGRLDDFRVQRESGIPAKRALAVGLLLLVALLAFLFISNPG